MNIENDFKDLSVYVKDRKISSEGVLQLRELIYGYYGSNKRDFPWRCKHDPYDVLVSEIMLQQTQTDRVLSKFLDFMVSFPTIEHLASAALKDVLTAWQGLGYNRRAMSLHTIAREITEKYKGVIPNDPTILKSFKGIGPNTAGSICAFGYNTPTIFIETNIRSVYIHLFFLDKSAVHDKEIIDLIEQTLDRVNPREWYYALMDYGVMLKKKFKNPSKKSVHYTKQSKFEGSNRQLRGKILKLLIEQSMTREEMSLTLHDVRLSSILEDLLNEGLVIKKDSLLQLP